MKREMGLDYLMREYILSPLNKINNFFWRWRFKFPDFSLTFQVLSKFPLPSTKFPGWFFLDLEKNSFSRYFSLTVATLLKLKAPYEFARCQKWQLDGQNFWSWTIYLLWKIDWSLVTDILTIRALDKREYLMINFLISHQNYMMWPLIWTVSTRRFRWGVTTYVFMQN